MWPRLTAGLWRSCVWRSTSPPHRAPLWTPAASASKVRQDGSLLPLTQPAKNKTSKRVQDINNSSLTITTNLQLCRVYLTCFGSANVEHHHCSIRPETARSNLCQQQAFSLHHHLHRAASHSAPLDQAKQHREETHGKKKNQCYQTSHQMVSFAKGLELLNSFTYLLLRLDAGDSACVPELHQVRPHLHRRL